MWGLHFLGTPSTRQLRGTYLEVPEGNGPCEFGIRRRIPTPLRNFTFSCSSSESGDSLDQLNEAQHCKSGCLRPSRAAYIGLTPSSCARGEENFLGRDRKRLPLGSRLPRWYPFRATLELII